jgi:hypothetical protein
MGIAALMFVAVAAWRIAGQLSSDALGMAIGVLFGVLAGVPAALLVMVSGRRGRARDDEEAGGGRRQGRGGQPGYYGGYGPGYPQQPPVIVLAAPGAPQAGYGGYPDPYGQPQRMRPALPGPETVDVRQFKVVGEKEEWVDEW